VWFGSYHYPAFNVADSAIAIGAALILLDVLLGQGRATPGISKEQKARR
jgi:signal peptidase II